MGELRANLDRLVRRWAVLALMVILGGAAGVLHAKFTPPTYTASAVLVATTLEATGDNRAANFSQAFARLVGQPDISGAAAYALKIPAEEVRKSVQATTSPDTPLVELTGSAKTPEQAAALVNAVATAVINIADTRQGDTGVTLLMLGAAGPPGAPTSPNLSVDVAVGVAAGFLLGGLYVVAAGGRIPPAPQLPPAPPPQVGPRSAGPPRRPLLNGHHPRSPAGLPRNAVPSVGLDPPPLPPGQVEAPSRLKPGGTGQLVRPLTANGRTDDVGEREGRADGASSRLDMSVVTPPSASDQQARPANQNGVSPSRNTEAGAKSAGATPGKDMSDELSERNGKPGKEPPASDKVSGKAEGTGEATVYLTKVDIINGEREHRK